MEEEDADDVSLQTEAPPAAAINEEEQAQAAAEVAAQQGTRRRRTAEEAQMGVNNGDVQGFQVVDESGNLVQQRFLQFLQTLYVNIAQ